MSPELLTKSITSLNTRSDKYRNTISSVSDSDTVCPICGEPKRRGGRYCGAACYRIVQRSTPVADRFWAKVDKSGACWLWTGNVFGSLGYGGFAMKRPDGQYGPAYAHRVAWELTHGPIPDNQHVLHACDVPRCVNPAHLFLGTHRDNMQDASAKQRLSNPRKRNRRIKAEVIRRYLAGGVTAQALADAHGIHTMTVHRWIKAATGGADQRFRSGNRRSA